MLGRLTETITRSIDTAPFWAFSIVYQRFLFNLPPHVTAAKLLFTIQGRDRWVDDSAHMTHKLIQINRIMIRPRANQRSQLKHRQRQIRLLIKFNNKTILAPIQTWTSKTILRGNGCEIFWLMHTIIISHLL